MKGLNDRQLFLKASTCKITPRNLATLEYRNRTFVNRNIAGGGGRASQTEPPFLRN